MPATLYYILINFVFSLTKNSIGSTSINSNNTVRKKAKSPPLVVPKSNNATPITNNKSPPVATKAASKPAVSAQGNKNKSKSVMSAVPGSTKISLIASKSSITCSGAQSGSDEGPQEKVTGPVNGDECYFWRTTGCQFGNACRYRHVKEHKGIDKKPWQIVR